MCFFTRNKVFPSIHISPRVALYWTAIHEISPVSSTFGIAYLACICIVVLHYQVIVNCYIVCEVLYIYLTNY